MYVGSGLPDINIFVCLLFFFPEEKCFGQNLRLDVFTRG